MCALDDETLVSLQPVKCIQEKKLVTKNLAARSTSTTRDE